MGKTCFFIGHRNAKPEVAPKLAEEIERHIVDYGVDAFVVGHYGQFDFMAAQAVIQAKGQAGKHLSYPPYGYGRVRRCGGHYLPEYADRHRAYRRPRDQRGVRDPEPTEGGYRRPPIIEYITKNQPTAGRRLLSVFSFR